MDCLSRLKYLIGYGMCILHPLPFLSLYLRCELRQLGVLEAAVCEKISVGPDEARMTGARPV